MNKESKQRYFSLDLLEWYGKHKRDLPWRRSRNPYHIWVSEIMLQQTRVDTVIPYFLRFIEKFPTIEALAEAPEGDVLKAWEGLGYYSRARNLQAAAQDVRERFAGVVPDDPEDIASLKGVGPYTAGAILSIAYNKPRPAVDGNVMRVFARFFLIRDDIAKPSTRIKMEQLAIELIPEGSAGDFNQALMELGATVCTPKSPHCLTCPVMEHCVGRLEGEEEKLPVKTKAKPPQPETRIAALIEGSGANAGKLLIRQRPQEGLLARMWELPHVQLPDEAAASAQPPLGAPPASRRRKQPAPALAGAGLFAGDAAGAGEAGDGGAMHGAAPGAAAAAEQAAADAAARGVAERSADYAFVGTPGEGGIGALRGELAAAVGTRIVPLHWLMDAEHTFSHIHWTMRVFRCREDNAPAALALPDVPNVPGLAAPAVSATNATSGLAELTGLDGEYRWITLEEMEDYAFPQVFIKILRHYEKWSSPNKTE